MINALSIELRRANRAAMEDFFDAAVGYCLALPDGDVRHVGPRCLHCPIYSGGECPRDRIK